MARWFGVLGAFACGSLLACGKTHRNDAPVADPDDPMTLTRHLVVRPRISLSGVSAAFAGETLGIAGIAHWLEQSPGDVVLAIDRGPEFELVDLGLGKSPAVAGSDDGFHVVWVEAGPAPPGLDTAKLAKVSTAGVVESVTDVGTWEREPFGCGVAAGGATVAVVCRTAAATCSAGVCQTVALPNCEADGRPAVVWDGEAFAVAHQCTDFSMTNLEIRYARLSPAGEWLTDLGIAGRAIDDGPHLVFGSRVALALHADHLMLAGLESMFAIDVAGAAIAPPVGIPRSEPIQANRIEYELVAAGDRILSVSTPCNLGLESSSGNVWMDLFNGQLEPIGSTSLVVGECSTVALASSAAGRAVLIRPTPGSTLVEELDLQSGLRSAPRLVASPAGEPAVRGVACEGAECTLAVFEPGVEPADPSFPDRFASVTLGGAEPSEEPLAGCTNPSCTVLLTSNGHTVTHDAPNLIWRDAAGVELWTRPTPTEDVVAFSFGNPAMPYASGADFELAWHWQLGPNGPVEQLVQGASVTDVLMNGAAIACDDGVYPLSFTGESTEIFAFAESGIRRKLGTLPEARRMVCAGGQFVTLKEYPDPPSISRLLPDGTVLTEDLGTPIVYWSVSGTSVALLLRGDADGKDGWDPSQRPILVELTPDGGTRRRELTLPEPGWFGFLSNLGSFDGGVQITQEFDHVVWKSENALMLSSFPR